MKKSLLFLSVIFTALQLYADPFEPVKDTTAKDTTKKKCQVWNENHYLDLSMAGGEGLFVSSVQWDKLFSVAWKKRFKIGFGVRVNMANYWDTDFRTPFYNRPSENIFDTLSMPHQTTFFVNLTFVMDLSLFRWLDIGLNEDLVGVSFGETGEGTYRSHASIDNNTMQDANPALLNAFLFGRNDRGSLNSQFYLRFWPSEDFFIKAGFGIVHITQQTGKPLTYGSQFFSDRYSGFISFGWTPGRNEWVKKQKKVHNGPFTPAF